MKFINFKDKFDKLIIILILLGVPLIFCVLTWDTLRLNKVIYFNLFLAFLYLIWLINIIFSKKISLIKTPFFWPLLLYLFLVGLSTAFSINILLSFDFFVVQLSLFLFYLWTINHIKEDSLDKLNNVIILTALIVSVYAVLQYLGIDFIYWTPQELAKIRPIATFGNPIFLAGFLVVVSPLFLSYVFKNKHKGNLILVFIGLLIIVSALFLTYCRSGLLAFGISIIFYFILLGKTLVWQNKKKIIIFLLILIFIPVILNFIPKETRTTDIYKERLKPDINVSTRLYLWKTASNLIKTKPWLGYGADTFSYTYTKYRYLEPVNIRWKLAVPDKVHNEFLELGVSCGIPALLVNLIIIFLFFKLGLSQKNKSDPTRRYLLAGYLSAGLAYQVHSFFNFSTLSTELLWWYLLGAITILNSASITKVTYKLNFLRYNIIKIGACFLILLSVFLIFKSEVTKWLADYHLKRAMNNRYIQKSWPYALREFNKSLTLAPFKADYWLRRGRFLEQAASVTKNPEAFNQAEYSYKQALKINQLNHYIWADWGRLLKNKYLVVSDANFLKLSIEKYQRAVELDPYNPVFHNDLGNVLNLAGYSKLAESHFLKSLEIYPNSSLTHTNLGIFYLQHKNINLAKKHLKKAVKLDPKNKRAWEFLEQI